MALNTITLNPIVAIIQSAVIVVNCTWIPQQIVDFFQQEKEIQKMITGDYFKYRDTRADPGSVINDSTVQ